MAIVGPIIIPDFEPGVRDIPMALDEGTLTVITDGIGEGGEGSQYTFSARLRKGDYVVLSTKDLTATKPSAGATELLGKIIDRPQWAGSTPRPQGSYEGVTYADGTYQPRIATIRVFGTSVEKVDLDAANSAIVPGQSVKTHATDLNKFDLYNATTKNNTRAIQNAAADSGLKIGVIFGFFGNLA